MFLFTSDGFGGTNPRRWQEDQSLAAGNHRGLFNVSNPPQWLHGSKEGIPPPRPPPRPPKPPPRPPPRKDMMSECVRFVPVESVCDWLVVATWAVVVVVGLQSLAMRRTSELFFVRCARWKNSAGQPCVGCGGGTTFLPNSRIQPLRSSSPRHHNGVVLYFTRSVEFLTLCLPHVNCYFLSYQL